MANLRSTIRQTTKYAAFFHTVLDDQGLHRWLICEKVISKNKLKPFTQKLTTSQVGEINKKRIISESKVIKANQVARFLSFFQTVSLVAITGSLAVGNASKNDDIDLMIVTKNHTLWLTRLFVIPFISLFFPRRHPATKSFLPDAVCLNLWLDESVLAVPENKRNLYTAHEVLQALPLLDRGEVYRRFLIANRWSSRYLANAFSLTTKKPSSQDTVKPGFLTYLLIPINFLAYFLQYLYMKHRITHETISLHAAYFHPRDLSERLNRHLGLY